MPNPASLGLPNPSAYTANADGTVTDQVTSLTWEGTADPGFYSQAQAAAYCANKSGGWRLPTRIELVSLLDFSTNPNITINQAYFPNTYPGPYWASSVSVFPSSSSLGPFWTVDFGSGRTEYDTGTALRSVRCVLALAPPHCYPTHYQVQPGGLVLDLFTGLTWQQRIINDRPSSPALSDCGTGWRLPSLNELQTIVDDTRAFPSIDETAFPNTPYDDFATSFGSWVVNFDAGATNAGGGPGLGRCVR
jgi:hypothetical protein